MLSFSSSHWQRDAQHASTPSPPPCSAAHSPHLWMFAFRIHRNTRHTPPLVDWRALCRDHGLSQQRPHFQVLKPKGSCDQGMVSRSQGLTTDDLSRSPPEHVEGPSSQPPWWPQELPPRCISAPPPQSPASLSSQLAVLSFQGQGHHSSRCRLGVPRGSARPLST